MPQSFVNKYVVYRIFNRINGCFYFGSTSDINKRWQTHKRCILAFNNGINPGREFYNLTLKLRRDIEFSKYTLEDFEFKIVRSYSNRNQMLACEQKLIDMYWNTQKCYNGDFEVISASVFDFYIAWNMVSMDYYLYRSIHAIKKDWRIPKDICCKILDGQLMHYNEWVIEDYKKIWSESEIKSFFRKCKYPYSKDRISERGTYSANGYSLKEFLTTKPIYIHKWRNLDNKKISMPASNHY